MCDMVRSCYVCCWKLIQVTVPTGSRRPEEGRLDGGFGRLPACAVCTQNLGKQVRRWGTPLVAPWRPNPEPLICARAVVRAQTSARPSHK